MCSSCLLLCVYVFFFKQKTAYGMRISDWSSDVCSSDLQDESLGAKFDYVEIPADMADKAAEYREQMIETVVEQDDAVMEAYLDGQVPDAATLKALKIGRASCRERVCQ